MYSANGGPATKKQERKLALVFKHTSSNQHVAGIESLAYSQDTQSLYTACRDSIVKRWNVEAGQPKCVANYEGHTDWVNDVLLFQDKLVTCSSDRTVRIWQSNKQAGCLHNFQHHSDYVTCLAASTAAGRLVSAGLRGEVITYDMQTLQAYLLMPQPSNSSDQGGSTASSHDSGDAAAGSSGGAGAPSAAAPMRSVYALAANKAGTLVAAGTTEAYIRLVDPRSGQKVMKLKGHTDNVRCLLLNKEGTLLLSGSSDQTVRLWDLGQQRCTQTLNVHTDSVWCLAAAPDFSVIYSGGRDKALYVTHLAQRKAWLLAREQQPIRSIALAPGTSRLWVATTSSTVSGYDIPMGYGYVAWEQQQQQQLQLQQQGQQLTQHRLEQQQPPQPWSNGSAVADASQQAAAPLGPTADASNQAALAVTAAAAITAGNSVAPAVAASPVSSSAAAASVAASLGPRALGVSASGRHVFGLSSSMRLKHSQDHAAAHGEVALLTIPAVSIQGAPGLVALRVLADKRHILTQDTAGDVALWDVLAGRPVQQLGQVDIAEVERQLFQPLYFESWFTADVKLGALAVNLESPKCFAAEIYAMDLGAQDVPDDQKLNLGACLLRNALSKWAHGFSTLFLSGALLPGLDDPGAEQLPHFSNELPPAVMSTDASGCPWRLSCTSFTGREREGEDLPHWACAAVLRGVLPFVKELKAAFVLQPAEGSGLPSLLQSRLSAPRILQVMKVCIVLFMSDQGLNSRCHGLLVSWVQTENE
eukprot:GHRR01018953.1.p1 GENE.GHRR01018953.1~~GHRR01018953.1.p1  ORF type:complete len:757 (+),score=249.11 GHRR01018953.1:300-2570(+)